jgi:SAM-dependent methyltransferase
MSDHRALILDQFTRQATPFATAPSIKDERALALVVEFAGAGPDDTVLDVACGPGLLACAFARVARHVTGIDITPAMLERARQTQAEQGRTNLTWRRGDVLPLPWPDGSFSIVCSRFAFHHFPDPLAVLREKQRVCRPGGRVVVVDSAPAPARADAFNALEKIRDPSHVRSLPLPEHEALFAAAGLPKPRVTTYRLESDLESLLARSFPAPGGAEEIRRRFIASLEDDALDIQTRRDGDLIRYGFPVAVLVADVRAAGGSAPAGATE